MKKISFILVIVCFFHALHGKETVNSTQTTFEQVQQGLSENYHIYDAKKKSDTAPIVIILTEQHNEKEQNEIREKITALEESLFFDIEVLGLENILKNTEYSPVIHQAWETIAYVDQETIVEPKREFANSAYTYNGPVYQDYLSDDRFHTVGLEDEYLYLSSIGFIFIEDILNLYLNCALGEDIPVEECSIMQLKEKDKKLYRDKDFPNHARLMQAYSAINFYADQYNAIKKIPESLIFDYTKIDAQQLSTLSYSDFTPINAHYIDIKDRDYLTTLSIQLLRIWAMDNIIIPRNLAIANNMAGFMVEEAATMGVIIIGDAHVDSNYGLSLQETENPENKTLQAYLYQNGLSYFVIRRPN